MKVLLQYDEVKGELTDRAGNLITTWVGLNHFPKEIPTDPKVAGIMVLKEGGFNAEEIKMLLQE